MAHIVSVFDEFGIEIASTKIRTLKNRARNLFLVEKNGNFCTNVNRILDKLC